MGMMSLLMGMMSLMMSLVMMSLVMKLPPMVMKLLPMVMTTAGPQTVTPLSTFTSLAGYPVSTEEEWEGEVPPFLHFFIWPSDVSAVIIFVCQAYPTTLSVSLFGGQYKGIKIM